MSRRMSRRGFAAGAALLACTRQKTQDVVIPPPSGPSAWGSALTAPTARDAFDPIGPRDLRAVVWSWTTAEQAAELARDRVLFTREESPTLGVGYLFTLLQGQKADAVVAAFVARQKKGRFGWFNPWATAAGMGGESYGDELLRIVLKPDAWMLSVRAWSSRHEIEVVDLRGAVVARADALAHPERIAGATFVSFGSGSGSCGTGSYSGGSAYREVYLGNPAQVLEWGLRTPAIQAELTRAAGELDAVAALDAKPADLCSWSRDVIGKRWQIPPAGLLERYESALAFPTQRYRPTQAQVAELARKLRATGGTGAAVQAP